MKNNINIVPLIAVTLIFGAILGVLAAVITLHFTKTDTPTEIVTELPQQEDSADDDTSLETETTPVTYNEAGVMLDIPNTWTRVSATSGGLNWSLNGTRMINDELTDFPYATTQVSAGPDRGAGPSDIGLFLETYAFEELCDQNLYDWFDTCTYKESVHGVPYAHFSGEYDYYIEDVLTPINVYVAKHPSSTYTAFTLFDVALVHDISPDDPLFITTREEVAGIADSLKFLPVVEEDVETKTFESAELGIRFSYPASIDDMSVTINDLNDVVGDEDAGYRTEAVISAQFDDLLVNIGTSYTDGDPIGRGGYWGDGVAQITDEDIIRNYCTLDDLTNGFEDDAICEVFLNDHGIQFAHMSGDHVEYTLATDVDMYTAYHPAHPYYAILFSSRSLRTYLDATESAAALHIIADSLEFID